MDVTLLRREFTDYDVATLPDLSRLAAAGFVDMSWHNDACPCVGLDRGDAATATLPTVLVYVDYADPAQREFPDSGRFTVLIYSEASSTSTQFDDWDAAVALATGPSIG